MEVGGDTDIDSDKSDDEHEGNLNHLGRKLLQTTAEAKSSSQANNLDETDIEPRSKTVVSKKSKERSQKVNWRKCDPSYEINTTCNPIPFSLEAHNCNTPVQFFELFFSENIFEHIVQQSNLYAFQKNIELNMSCDELKVFIGGILMSGYAKYPNKRMYWSNESDTPTLLSQSMRLKRFEKILNNLHLNDNSKINADDRLYKLRPIIDHLNEVYPKHGGLIENLAVDESMIPYYGKHYAKQFIRGKPIRFGFKNWALNSNDGYMLQFDIYVGKNAEVSPQGFGVGGDKVIDLLEKAHVPQHKGFKVCFMQ